MGVSVDDLISDSVSSAGADDGYVDVRDEVAGLDSFVDASGADEDGYLETEAADDGAEDGYVDAPVELSFEDLIGYDEDVEPLGSFVGGDPADDGYLDGELGFGTIGDGVGADESVFNKIFGFSGVYFGADSKVSAAGQAAIKSESAALKAQTGHAPELITVLNALLASGGISQADATAAAVEHGKGAGGLNFGSIVSDIGSAAGSLAKGAEQAAGAVAKGVGEEVSTAVNTVGQEAKTVESTIGKAANDVAHGNFGGALGAVSAGAKAVANEAATGFKDELAHVKATAQSAATDLLNGVKGAEKSLLAIISQFTPADFIEMIEGDFNNIRGIFDSFISGQKVSGADTKADPNAIDFSSYSIPSNGAVASLFPKQYRGTTVRWVDARKNAGTLLWYLCGLALVDALHLRNQILKVFGIKSADSADAVYGFAPLAAVAGNIPMVLMILVAVFVIATVVVATVAGPNTVLGKLANKIEKNPLFATAAKALGLSGLVPGQPPGPVIPPNTGHSPAYVPLTNSGHSSPGITYAVIGVAAVLLILFIKSQRESV